MKRSNGPAPARGRRSFECKTYRTRPHAEGMGDFGYRTREEVDGWKARCPIVRFGRTMCEEGQTNAGRARRHRCRDGRDDCRSGRFRRVQPLARSRPPRPSTSDAARRSRSRRPAASEPRAGRLEPRRPTGCRRRSRPFVRDGGRTRRSSSWAKALANGGATSARRSACTIASVPTDCAIRRFANGDLSG